MTNVSSMIKRLPASLAAIALTVGLIAAPQWAAALRTHPWVHLVD